MKLYRITILALLAVSPHTVAYAQASDDFEDLKQRADAALAELDEARRDEQATSLPEQQDIENESLASEEQSDNLPSVTNQANVDAILDDGPATEHHSVEIEPDSGNNWNLGQPVTAADVPEDEAQLIAQEVEQLRAEIEATQEDLEDLSEATTYLHQEDETSRLQQVARLRRVRAEYRYQLALLILEAALLQSRQDQWAMQQRRILARRHAWYRDARHHASWRLEKRRRIIRDRQARQNERRRVARHARIQQRRRAARHARIQQRRRVARIQQRRRVARHARIQQRRRVARHARIQQRRRVARNARIQQRRRAARNARIQQRRRAAKIGRTQARRDTARNSRARQGYRATPNTGSQRRGQAHRDRTLRRVVRSAPGASMRNLKRGHQALRRHASKRLKSERRLSRNLKRNTRSKKAQRRKGKNRFPRLRRDS